MAAGTSAAQILSFLLMPVITRFYSPSDMGVFAIYLAVSTVIGMLANLRLDLAVVQGADHAEGARLVWLSFAFSTLFAVLTGLGLWVLRSIEIVTSFSLLLIGLTALSVMANGFLQALVNWHSRHENFAVLGLRSGIERLFVLVMSLGLAWTLWRDLGLVVAQTLGLWLSVFYLWIRHPLPSWRLGFGHWVNTWQRFRDFPRTMFWSSLISLLAFYASSFLYNVAFTKELLGFFNLATRLLEMPINLIGFNFSTVYYRFVSQKELGEKRRLFWKSLRLLIAVFAVPFLVLGLWSPEIFAFVFGEPWRFAGELAQWLVPFGFVRLLFVTQSTLFLVERRLKLDLAISVLLFSAQILGFAIGYFGYGDFKMVVMAASLLSTLVYLIGLGMIGRMVGV